VLVVSKVANFSIDLPEASVAVQVSGTFGSRQEEAQRLGRLLRPKGDGRQAHFYSVVSATRSTPSTPPTGSASSPSRATRTASSTPDDLLGPAVGGQGDGSAG
jgi:DNA excision repair protein ERCC-3